MASSFNPKEDKFIVTLTGEPDWQVFLWNWDREKLMAKTSIGCQGPINVMPCNFQISYNPFDNTQSTVLVTGPSNTYVYMKLRREENDMIFTQEHSQINSLEEGRAISTNFTCHSWSQTTGMILVCTDNGEMLLCNNNGEYKSYILDSPLGAPIDAVYSFSNGFVIGSENNLIVFQSDDGDERALLRKDGDSVQVQMNPPENPANNVIGYADSRVLAVTATEEEKQVFAIMDNGQLVTAALDLEDNTRNSERKFDFVMGPFHRDEITGLDVCIQKELIVTCSKDKTCAIWNYATKSHEFSYGFTEECLTVAFHPSGLHLVVALQDKILMMNLLSEKLQQHKMLSVKGCNEIRFSNGGHLFACTVNQKDILVYDFYTADCPPNMNFSGHVSRVMSIDWFANDMGFTSCGQDGNIYFFDLYQPGGEQGKRNLQWDANRRDMKFSSVVNVPNRPYQFIAVGSEKIIFTETKDLKAVPRITADNPQPVADCPRVPHYLSQLVVHHSGKIFFAGVGDLNGQAQHPGAIQVWKLPFEKASEIQAHASSITRMSITHSNTHLFSAG